MCSYVSTVDGQTKSTKIVLKKDQKDLGGEAPVSTYFLRGSIDLEGGRIHGRDPVHYRKVSLERQFAP